MEPLDPPLPTCPVPLSQLRSVVTITRTRYILGLQRATQVKVYVHRNHAHVLIARTKSTHYVNRNAHCAGGLTYVCA